MARIHLSFYRDGGIELDEIEFLHPLRPESILSVRGKSPAGRFADASFQWTSALQALTVLFLKGAARELGFSLSGSHGSAAASLDFAISKQPQWVEDVFGVDKQGVSLLRRVVERSNSNLKRPGPVTVSLNRAALQENSITITVNGKDVSNILEIRALADDLALQLWGELPMQEDRARRLAA